VGWCTCNVNHGAGSSFGFPENVDRTLWPTGIKNEAMLKMRIIPPSLPSACRAWNWNSGTAASLADHPPLECAINSTSFPSFSTRYLSRVFITSESWVWGGWPEGGGSWSKLGLVGSESNCLRSALGGWGQCVSWPWDSRSFRREKYGAGAYSLRQRCSKGTGIDRDACKQTSSKSQHHLFYS